MSQTLEVNVAGRPWAVRFVSETKMRKLNPSTDAIGLTFGQDLTIYVAAWVHPRVQRETLLHELLHACVFGTAPDSTPADDTDFEEHFISGVDAPLLATLRDNPELLAYLTA